MMTPSEKGHVVVAGPYKMLHTGQQYWAVQQVVGWTKIGTAIEPIIERTLGGYETRDEAYEALATEMMS